MIYKTLSNVNGLGDMLQLNLSIACKFYIFIAALEAKLFYLAILGVLSSVISAFYYLRIIKVMYFDDLEIANYQSNISSKASLILFFTMLAITMFIFYPSLIINIGSNISIDFFNN